MDMTAENLPIPTVRATLLRQLAQPKIYDVAIVGGGATGLGVALDAAARGFSVLLVESHDFAKGTSSRATKLVHGGVRYLAQGNIALVKEALHERANLLRNASHLAQPLPFVMPSYQFWEKPYYGVGLKMYDALAGQAGLGKTELLGRDQTIKELPGVQTKGLKGGVKYWDGQFDDARLALSLARSAAARGALLVNYCAAKTLTHESGKVTGFVCEDQETGQTYTVRAQCVINATGVWVDALRQQDGDAICKPVQAIVAPSQGVHLVVDREFFPGDHALLVPKTADGRVLFAVPWLGKVILGTTDTPRTDLAREPEAFKDEVAFILRESANYLSRPPSFADVKSIWVGLRPLVKLQPDDSSSTKSLSREHTVLASSSQLVSVTGGKWTTYRAMAEDVLQKCFDIGALPTRVAGVTQNLALIAAPNAKAVQHKISAPFGLHMYGTEQMVVQSLPGSDRVLGDGLTEAMVRFAAQFEYARTVEDVLARRSRVLFLDAALAKVMAPEIARILESETQQDPKLTDFIQLATQYLKIPAQ